MSKPRTYTRRKIVWVTEAEDAKLKRLSATGKGGFSEVFRQWLAGVPDVKAVVVDAAPAVVVERGVISEQPPEPPVFDALRHVRPDE